MYRTNNINKQVKGVSREIRKKVGNVLQKLQLDLRMQEINRQQRLQQMQVQLKKFAKKVNQFSNVLLTDDFEFASLQDHPIVMIRYCEIIFDILIDDYKKQMINKQTFEHKRQLNESNIYTAMSQIKLQNFDLKQQLQLLMRQIQLSKKRAQLSQGLLMQMQIHTQNYISCYSQNTFEMCSSLKSSQQTQIQLLQSNRFLKQQLQSLQIQFQRYKTYYKQGPSIKDKEDKMRIKLEKDYDEILKRTIRQVEKFVRQQLQQKIRHHFNIDQNVRLKF